MGNQYSKADVTYNNDNALDQKEADQIKQILLEEIQSTRNMVIMEMCLISLIVFLFLAAKFMDFRMKKIVKEQSFV